VNISLLKFQIVELLAKHKKITTVADALGLKQPTVTFHMKGLEQELGVRLFEVRSGKTQLTEAGHSLLHYAVKINALANEAERIVKEFADLGRGTLNIGASYVPATYVLPVVLSTFSKTYPKISISLSVKTAPVIEELLVNHEIDMGVLSTEPFHNHSLHADAICEDELVMVYAANHPIGQYADLNPGQLARIPFVFHGEESSTRRMTDKWAKNNGVSLNAQLELDSLEAIKQAVMLGDHISFISKLAIRQEVRQGSLSFSPIPRNTFTRFVYCATNVDREPSSLLESFIYHIKKKSL
jgi:DNA-binding transcriptional LysR family regulator